MPASDNKRIYFAVQQVGLKPDGDTGAFNELHGVQSVGITTNFNLEQVQELGQLEIYENIEQIPDVEVTMTKVLDGYPLIWHRATQEATAPTLAGRSNEKAIFALGIFPDTNDSASGPARSIVQCSGMFVSSLAYNFPLEDNFSEDVTLVGSDKQWYNDPKWASSPTLVFDGAFAANNDSPIGQGGVNRRENVLFDYNAASGLDTNGMVADPDATVLPPDVFGISDSGTNEESNGQDKDAHLSSISVSADFGRTEIFELGRRAPYHRTLDFPTEVTTEIEVTTTSGDMKSATEDGILSTGTGTCVDQGNLTNRTIRIAVCEGTRIYTGLKNKLSSVNYAGGDAGGGNVTVTYTFSTFNDLTVLHSGDPNSNGSTWWTERGTHLVN